MANIKRIDGKTGVSYKVTVTRGRDSSGKQISHYMTWTPPAGEKRAEREAQKAAIQFETQIEQGFQADDRQSFEQYARYVIDLKERKRIKHNTDLFLSGHSAQDRAFYWQYEAGRYSPAAFEQAVQGPAIPG